MVKGFPVLPSKGDVVIVVGNKSICEPCRKLSEFLEKERFNIGVVIFEIDLIRFNNYFTDSRIYAVPKIFYMRDGKVIHTENGFKDGPHFIGRFVEIFGKK